MLWGRRTTSRRYHLHTDSPRPRPHHPSSPSPAPLSSPPTSPCPFLSSSPSKHPFKANTQCASVGRKFVGTKSGGAAWLRPTQPRPRVLAGDGQDRQLIAAGAVEQSRCRPAVAFRRGAPHRAGTAPGKHGGLIANGLRTFELSLAPSRSRSRPSASLRSRFPPSPGPPKTGRLSLRRLRLGWHRDAFIAGTCRPSLPPCDASSKSGIERSSKLAEGRETAVRKTAVRRKLEVEETSCITRGTALTDLRELSRRAVSHGSRRARMVHAVLNGFVEANSHT